MAILLFKEWLCKTYQDDSSYFGDLARDVAEDASFPESNTISDLITYLAEQNACDEAIGALGDVFEQFEKVQPQD